MGSASLAHHSSFTLICHYEPRAAVAPVDSKLGGQPQLAAGGTVERIDVTSVAVVPKVVGDENLDTNLPLHHERDYTKRPREQSITPRGTYLPGTRDKKRLQSADDVARLRSIRC